MPPFPFNHLALVDLVNRPQVAVRLVQKNRLENMPVIRDWGLVGFMVHAELMLIVGAVECHFNLLRVFRVGMRVVHGPKTARFAVLALGLVFGEFDLLFLILGFRFRTQVWLEARFVILLKIFGIRVGDGDVVKEPRPTEYKPLFPSGGFPKELLSVICEDCHDQLVKCLGFRSWACVLACAVVLFGVKGSGLEHDTLFASTYYGRDVRIGANIDSF